MKKKIVCLLPLLCLPFMLVSCQKEHVNLTYGTYIESTLEKLKEIDSDELDNRLSGGETLLLAAYQGEYSKDCLCWITFKNVIVNYINTYHEEVFLFNAQEQNESVKKYNIQKFNESTPKLYVFNGEKLIASYSESKRQDKAIFNEASSMYSHVHKVVNQPSLYYVDDSYLDNNLAMQDETLLLFIRNACGDCKYVLPNVIIPYVNSHSLKKNIWLFDMQSYYETSKKETANEEEKAVYQNIKDKYQLSASSNDKFGYLNGVVPTIHYYKNGELKGAAVYFNDVVSKNEDGKVYISDSFYAPERMNYLTYLVDYHKASIAKDKELGEDAIQTPSGDYYWAQEKAAAFYTPIWNTFLDYYLQ